jgi:hypothetical protein
MSNFPDLLGPLHSLPTAGNPLHLEMKGRISVLSLHEDKLSVTMLKPACSCWAQSPRPKNSS